VVALLIALPACRSGNGPPAPFDAGGVTEAGPALVRDATPAGLDDATVGPDGASDAEDQGQIDALHSDGSDDARPLEPIRVFRGSPGSAAHTDLRFLGVNLEQYEGAVVTFAIGAPALPGHPLGSGQVRIVEGRFDVSFPKVLWPAYIPKQAHIDVDHNGSCDPGEPLFIDNAAAEHNLTLTVEPDASQLFRANASGCARFDSFPKE
jgi:hypothetical protein